MTEKSTQWTIMGAYEDFTVGCLVLDGWELKKNLGRGGFGNVFLAEKSVFGIQDQAAIKIIRIPQDSQELELMRSEGLSEEDIQVEMRRNVEIAVTEIRAMIGLKGCPAAVSCDGFDVVQYEEDGTWSILIRMELLEPLTQWVRKSKVGIDDVVRMGVSLCTLLAECEKRNILHRDIKPANIFIDQMNNFKLGDFGLARLVSDMNSLHSRSAGTEAFMAPEVAAGNRYDYRADIYSLGLVMYWLLNHQQLPFFSSGLSRTEAVGKRLSGVPLPSLNDINTALDGAVRKACSPNPADRWKSAEEFCEALTTTLSQPQSATVTAFAHALKKSETDRKVLFSDMMEQTQAQGKKARTASECVPPSEDLSFQQKDVGTHLCRFTEGVIKKYLGNQEKVTVPTKGNKGQKVYIIGPEAFSGKTKLKEIVIPEGITYIGFNAFYQCQELWQVTLPDSLEAADITAFDQCNSRLVVRCHRGTYADEYCNKARISVQYI